MNIGQRLFLVLVAWKVFWFVAYRVFGIYLGYITINNGILFNWLRWSSSKLSLTAGSVRFRLWGNSKRIIVLDLKVEVLPSNPGKQKLAKHRSKLSGSQLSLYPENRLGKFVFTCILKILPSFDFELKSADVTRGNFHIDMGSVTLQVKLRKSVSEKNVYRTKVLLSGTQLSGKSTVERRAVPWSLGLFSIMNSFSIHKDSGILSNISSRVQLDDPSIDIFHAMKQLLKSSPRKQHDHHSLQEIQPQLDLLSNLHNKFFRSFNEFSINLSNIQISGISLFPAGDNCSLTEYFDQEEPDSSLKLSVKSSSFHLSRVVETAAGVDVLFDKSHDKPIELTFSALVMKLFFVTRQHDKSNKEYYSVGDEFFSFPNCTFTFKSNVTDQLAKGHGFRNCAIELFLTGSSPMLDVDAEQFALLAYNYVVLRKLLKLRKLRLLKHTLFIHTKRLDSSDCDESEDDTKIADSTPGTPSKAQQLKADRLTQFVDKVVLLLNEFYPRIDVKMTIEQPRAVLRSQQGTTTQLLMLSFSTIFFHVLTTDSEDYIAKCQFLHPSMTLSERFPTGIDNSHYQQDFCGISHASLRVDIMKNLKFKVSIAISGAFVSLAKPDVLNGINSIIRKTTKVVNRNMKHGLINIHYDAEIVKERDLHPSRDIYQRQTGSKEPLEKIFEPLPSWILLFEVLITELSVELGSTSPLLPPELISKLAEKTHRTIDATRSILSFYIDESKWGLHSSDELESESSVSNSSLDTLAGESNKLTFWRVSKHTRAVSLSLIEENVKLSPILEIPNFGCSVSAVRFDNENKIICDFDVDEVRGFIDRYRVFAMMGLVYLLKVTIIEPLQKLKEKMKRSTATLRHQRMQGSDTSLLNRFELDFQIHKVNYIAALSDDFKVRLQLYQLALEMNQGTIIVTNSFSRLLADSPVVSGYWNRLVCLDSLTVKINDPNEIHKVVIQTPSLRLIQPHRFVVYKLFDNMGIFIKITKHLVKCLKSEEKETVVYPKDSKPIKPVPTKFLASKVTFAIEDDPFEAELNMIYQLGLQEQRKRMEIMDLFDERCGKTDSIDQTYVERLEQVQKVIELLWIRKIQSYKAKLAEEIMNDKDFLFGSELKIAESENHRVATYFRQAPLLHVIFSGLNLDLSEPKFPLEQLPDFIYKYGQEVPKDTLYNLMIPTHINLTVDEVRMHLRDYPLPLLYIPKSPDVNGRGKALVMKGHLIISESLILQEEHLRRLEMPLIRKFNKHFVSEGNFDKLIIEKSMSTVKLYTDLDIVFDSHSPARFVWGQSYNFAIQQVMLNVDQFSKPPVDPSPKLGFWDKMRLVLHGKCDLRTGKDSSIEVAFKGGSDPYSLFEKSSGFILSFKDDVKWRVNENDQSLNFFNILARKVAWYIPNYLQAPLVSWCRESSKSTYIPAIKEIVNSCYAYYLNGKPDGNTPLPNTSGNTEKGVVELNGGVTFILGFLLQRKTRDGKHVTDECRPHWEVELFNPEYTEEGHDSYRGFRSDRIHMAISLVANNENSYNTIHLTPGVFKQYFAWWKMFHSNMMLPVRKGIMFGELKKSTKFSDHLFTIKYLFDIKNLFISHILRGDAPDDTDDNVEFFGLKGKVNDFLMDLHQRKEERIDEREELSRNKKIMKMTLNRGEVTLNKIDLRAMYARFAKDLYEQHHNILDEKCKYLTFDDDRQWFDRHDFREVFDPSSGGRCQKIEAIPLMYSENFSYIRDTTDNNSKVDWGYERTHDCKMNRTDIHSTQIEMFKRRITELDEWSVDQAKLGKNHDEVNRRIETLKKNIQINKRSKERIGRQDSIATAASLREHFHNRFILISMFFKWNENVRNVFMKYIHFVQLNGNFRKYLSFEFMTMLESIVQKNDSKDDDALSLASSQVNTLTSLKKLKTFLNKFESSQERLENFDEILRLVQDTNTVVEDYKIEIISPQIQLNSQADKNSIVLIAAPMLESKIISVVTKKESHLILNNKELETRYGVLLHDACVMVLEKQNVKLSKSLILEKHPYGTTSSWPPFLGIEVCKDYSLAPKEDILIKKMSLMLTYDQVKALGSNIEQMEGNNDAISNTETTGDAVDDNVNRLRVDCPELIINCTSKQYFTLYITLLNLLLYSEPMSVNLRERISKLKFSINFQNFMALQAHLLGLHKYLEGMETVMDNYKFRDASNMDNEALNDYLLLRSLEHNISTEIVLILQTLFSGDVFADSSAQPMSDWRIAADHIVLHMLTDEREPILNLLIERGVCKRIVKEDGSNDNRIEIRNIEGINKIESAYYDKILAPLSLPEHDNLITVDWSMKRSIGGIRIMENFDIRSQPLDVKIDEITGRQLMKFIFQTDDEDKIEESPVINTTDQKRAEKDFQTGRDESESGEEDEEAARSNVELSLNQSETGDAHKRDSMYSKEVRFKGRSNSLKVPKKKTSSKDLSSSSGSDSGEVDDDVTEMIRRSKKYLTIVSMTSHAFELMISLRLTKGKAKWLNVTNFNLALPEWHIDREVMSMLDIADVFKKMIIKALLQHLGLLILNKLKTRGQNAKLRLKRS